MANRLFQRLLSKFGKGVSSAGYRSAAMNGADNVRLRIVREEILDQETLSMLARRGPSSVRLLVAKHASLQFETARRLVGVDDKEFRDALKARFGELEAQAAAVAGRESVPPPGLEEEIQPPVTELADVPSASLAELPLVVLSIDELHDGSEKVNVESAGELEPTAVDGPVERAAPTASLGIMPAVSGLAEDAQQTSSTPSGDTVDFVALVPQNEAAEHQEPSAARNDKGADLGGFESEAAGDSYPADLIRGPSEHAADDGDDLASELTDYSSEDLDLAREEENVDATTLETDDEAGLQELLDLVADTYGDEGDWGPGYLDRDEVDWIGESDDAADIVDAKVIQVFEKIPDGPAGRELLDRLSKAGNGATIRVLVRLKKAGWGIDEISTVWWARSAWNESHGIGRYDYPLDYWTVAILADTFEGFPDEDELLLRLNLIGESWKSDPHRGRTPLNQYVRQKVSEYAAAWHNGGHAPLDSLLGGWS